MEKLGHTMIGNDQNQAGIFHIFVNKKKLETSATSLTGKAILELAQLSPSDYDLFLVKGQGESDPIGPDQPVGIRNGLHFNAIAKGVNFGGTAGA